MEETLKQEWKRVMSISNPQPPKAWRDFDTFAKDVGEPPHPNARLEQEHWGMWTRDNFKWVVPEEKGIKVGSKQINPTKSISIPPKQINPTKSISIPPKQNGRIKKVGRPKGKTVVKASVTIPKELYDVLVGLKEPLSRVVTQAIREYIERRNK